MDKQILISLDLIDPNPYQPRQVEDPDAVAELAADIKKNTLLQVPVARPAAGGRYQLAFGHTRKAAFVLNGEECMPLIVRDLTDLQMFEQGVSENIKRRDLNPIEQAQAMRVYMDGFGKTSKEAGEFFNVAEETIRQKVRLLKLPEPVQAKMRAGAINETTARSLLSMQRVASEEAVIKTVKEIEANKDNAVPERVIEHTIENLRNVVQLRTDNRMWPIEMKKFPNAMLPAMTEQMVGTYESQLEHLANPPACNACPFYTKVRGSHYCGLKICYERKQIAWGRHLLEKASKNLGIPIYNQEEDGAYLPLDSSYASHKKAFTDRHKGLRLIAKSDVSQYVYQWALDGVDTSHMYVVVTGAEVEKLNQVGVGKVKGGKKSEKEKAEMRMMRVYRARRKELLWAFTDVAKNIFAGVPVEAVKEIMRWKFVGVDDQIPPEWLRGKRETAQIQADFERRQLVWHMIYDVCSHYRRQTMADVLNSLQEQAANWKIKLPTSLSKLAQEIDAEVSAAAAPKVKK